MPSPVCDPVSSLQVGDFRWGEVGKLSKNELVKIGVTAESDPEKPMWQGQEGPHEPPHYSLTGVGILPRMEGGANKLGYLVKLVKVLLTMEPRSHAGPNGPLEIWAGLHESTQLESLLG